MNTGGVEAKYENIMLGTCGIRRRMPADCMSSQPKIRRSVSACKSRPSSIEGVGESLSSGMRELSIVR